MLSYFTGVTQYNIEFIVIQIVAIAVITLISVFFATDYYEEVIFYTEKFISIKNKTKRGNYQADYTEKQLVKKKKKVDVNFAPKGPWAYVWLKMIENKREMGSIYFNYYNLAILVISIAFGYFLPKNEPTIIFALAFIHAYIGWLTSFISAISGELNKMYIYIIPGEGIEKLIAVNAVPILKSFITALLLIAPASILIKCGILNALTAILFILGFTTLANFSSSFLNTLLPSKADLKAVLSLFKLFAFVIVLVPVGAISVPLGIVTKSMTIGVLSADIAMLLMSGVFLLFANFAFERLELK
ncbi:putative ABC exporter domain-containing protein [Thermoanaerobacterium sp. RBIITD]|uniref:putative ABC exporter domain-containing protein n=1 Tax=Thermoanaerobacterium sp. RBIITD TaxID=1550240 RepID=UPI002100C00A|nr:putative ABC exporter domain-containing protein [Thermoanaerobacterium sp. RBIITD]